MRLFSPEVYANSIKVVFESVGQVSSHMALQYALSHDHCPLSSLVFLCEYDAAVDTDLDQLGPNHTVDSRSFLWPNNDCDRNPKQPRTVKQA
jgi:hypothetical protein